jgi:2-polyprenyl-6-hydroxyphenyl methylase/3-demethylubiquinone-9 3-methyltransferase
VPFFLHDLATGLPQEHVAKYDAVISVEVIEHLFLPRTLMSTAASALKPGGIFVLTTPFHGYWKNLALALSNKFDEHWHPLRDHGHIKFFSENTITALFNEYNFQNIQFRSAGRIPILACSMIISGKQL